MIKNIFIGLLVFAVMLQTFSKLIIVAKYEFNKKYIAAVLCENKAKPKMHCNGKCHLKRELQKDEKKQKAAGGDLKDKSEVQICSSYSDLKVYIYEYSYFINTPYKNSGGFSPPGSIFHPPSLLS